MFEYAKRYFFAKAICKRRDTQFIPMIFKLDRGSYSFCLEGKEKHSRVWVSLFSDRFYEILAHEVGHLMDYKSRCYRVDVRKAENLTAVDYSVTYTDGSHTCMTLHRELRASRGARLLLKSWGKLQDDSMDYLNWCYGTYIRGYPKDKVADVSYQGMKYLKAKT